MYYEQCENFTEHSLDTGMAVGSKGGLILQSAVASLLLGTVSLLVGILCVASPVASKTLDVA